MLISKDEFDRIFTAEYKRLLLKCIHEGLADYNNPKYYSAEARRDHTKSARALNRHCHIVARMNRALIEHNNIRAITKKGRPLFIFNDKLQFSIKKFDSRLRTSNVPTRQANAFKAQLSLDVDMPPELTNVFTGYRYNLTETYYEVYITCPDYEQNFWIWKISGAEITDFFSDSPSVNIDDIGTVSIKKPRVLVRPGAQRRAKENE
ncbi:MAG TPA: hypothetical protein VNG51_12060 [Ktedonobacteraceae bacterium]|nr:hypothetical protein [Ktedonobacteraceae bacterium]